MSDMPPTPSATPRYTTTQRRLLTVSAGLGVAVLAGAAFVVTYDDLRTLAVEGHAPRRFASAYPVMFDALITVTILALVVARSSRWWNRWPRWLLLLVLLAGAAAASVQRATKGYAALPDDALKAGIAVAPHVMLLLAIWLWLTMFRQVRAALARRTASPADVSAAADGSPPADDLPTAPGPVSGPVSGDEPVRHHLADDQVPDTRQDTSPDAPRHEPWAAEEAPLDWALVPYEPEPAPLYEPDPAIQPYEPGPIQPYEADPPPEPAGYEITPPEPAGHEITPPEPVVHQNPIVSASLPTDIKLVGRLTATTRPDIVMPAQGETGPAPGHPAGDPQAGPPVTLSGFAGDEEGADVAVVDRAEDPDADEDHPAPRLEPEETTEVEWRPPSSTFRSSPTPPHE
jgi:Protein of unknown function (DUF2637)